MKENRVGRHLIFRTICCLFVFLIPALFFTCKPGGKPMVTGFSIVDEKTGTEIRKLTNGDTLDMKYDGRSVYLKAITIPVKVGSLRYGLNQEDILNSGIEESSLLTGEYFYWELTRGSHTLTAVPYLGPEGKGLQGEPFSLHCLVLGGAAPRGRVNIKVKDFTLVNAGIDKDVGPLDDGGTITLSEDLKYINIRANTIPPEVGSVLFKLNEDQNYKIENVGPYALGGDNLGDYFVLPLKAGRYKLTAVPYFEGNTQGPLGYPLTITFVLEGEVPEEPEAEAME